MATLLKICNNIISMLKSSIVKGSKSGSILFLHGNSSSSRVFSEIMISDIIQQTKISIDLPGHGGSCHQDTNLTVTEVKKELIDFILSIKEEVLIVGNSLGGHLAIEIALGLNNLKGLVIFGTPPFKKPINFEEAFIPNDALNTFLIENPTIREVEKAIKYAVHNEDHQHILIEDFMNANPKVRSSLMKDFQEENWSDQEEVFTNLDIPKYIIKGEQDPSVNPKYIETVCQKSKNCTLIEFKNCGHYPSLEKPEEFIKTIKLISESVFQ